MKKFDKVVAKALRDEIDAALKSVGEKYDITFHAGSCRFSEIEMTYKLVVKTNDNEAVEEKNKKDWARYCEIRGFDVEDFGKTFESRGSEYTIVGFEMSRSKYDLKARKTSNGQIYCFVSEQIAKKFRRDVPTTSGFNERNAGLKERVS